MVGRKRGAAKAGLTGEDRRETEKALGDLRASVTLLGRAIDGVLDGLHGCHIGLIQHGTALVLNDGGTTTSPNPAFSTLRSKVPMLEPGAVVKNAGPGSAVSMERGALKTEPPSVKSVQRVPVGQGAARGEPAAAVASPTWPILSEPLEEAATDDALSKLSEESAATSSPTTSTSSRSSTKQPSPPPTKSSFDVLLEWYAAAPGVVAGQVVESLHTAVGLGHKSRLQVPRFFQIWDKNSDRGGGGDGGAGGATENAVETAADKAARKVDLVVWHLTQHTMELPVNENFTAAKVGDALGRDFALNFAMVTLLEAVNDQYCHRQRSENGDDANRACDPDAVGEFFARFEANVQALMEEARSAPVSFSAPPSNFPESVEDSLRMALASVRHRHREQEESNRSPEENLAPADAVAPAAGCATAAPGAMLGHALHDNALRDGFPHNHASFVAADAQMASPTLVLRPMEDLFRVFSDAELMAAITKTADGELPRGCYEMWFEKKRVVRTGVAFRHEYVMKTGHWYGG